MKTWGTFAAILACCLALAGQAAFAADDYYVPADDYYCVDPPVGSDDDYYCVPDDDDDDDDDDDGGGPGPGGPGGPGGGGGGGGGGGQGRQCTSAVGKVGRNGIGRFQLGAARQEVMNAVGAPARKTGNGRLSFCVKGGGNIRVAFLKARAAAIMVAAQGYSLKGINIGDSRRSLPKTRRVNKRLFLVRKTGVVGMRKGFVNDIGVVTPKLARSKKHVQRVVKRANG